MTSLSPFVGNSTSSQAQGKQGNDITRVPPGNVLCFSVKIIHLSFSLTLHLFLLKRLSSNILLVNSL